MSDFKINAAEFIKLAKEAKADMFNLSGDINALYSKEELVIALQNLAQKYPMVYKHFVLLELESLPVSSNG